MTVSAAQLRQPPENITRADPTLEAGDGTAAAGEGLTVGEDGTAGEIGTVFTDGFERLAAGELQESSTADDICNLPMIARSGDGVVCLTQTKML